MARVYCLVALLVLIGLFHASEQRDCFSNGCHGGFTWAECISGTWDCPAGDFCQVNTESADGRYTTKCIHPNHQAECDQAASSSPSECTVANTDNDCTWCCADADCINNLG